MTDTIRCPMCSRPNPADLDVCQFCQARLKPLIIRQESDKTQPLSAIKPAASQANPSDWLNSIRSDQEPAPGGGSSPTEEGQNQDEGKVPDWLARVRERNQQEKGSEQNAPSSEEAPDWLTSSEPLGEEEPGEVGEDSRLGWFENIRDSSTTGETPEQAEAPGGSWMDSLRTDQESAAEEAPASPIGGAEEPSADWRLGEEENKQEADQPEEDAFDRRGIMGDQPPSSEIPAWEMSGSDESQENAPDWLQNLKDETGETEPVGKSEPAKGEPAAAGSEEGFTDWLQSLKDETGQLTTAGEPEPTENEPAESEPAAAETEVSSTDWLQSLKVETGQLTPAGEPEPIEAEPAAAEAEESSTDWLQSLKDETGQLKPVSEPVENEPAAAASAVGLTDWLQSINTEPGQEEQAGEPTSSQPTEEFSDWLDNLKGETEQAEPTGETGSAEVESRPAGSEESFTEWLQNLKSKEGQAEPTAEPAASEPAEDFSGWVHSLKGEGEPVSELEPAVNEPAALPAEEIPDWMQALKAKKAAEEGIQEAETGAVEPIQTFPEMARIEPAQEAAGSTEDLLQDLYKETSPTEGLPADWFADLDQAQPAEATPVEKAVEERKPVPTGVDETPPDWLAALGAAGSAPYNAPSSEPFIETPSASAPTGSPTTPFKTADMPDWLSKPGQGAPQEARRSIPRQAGEEAGVEEASGEDLAPAELPGWVKAMRPIESVATETGMPLESDQRIERSGPLTGLKGVLPFEAAVTGYKKPPVYSTKLQASDSQKHYAEVLQDLLTNETKTIPTRGTRAISRQRILRIVVGVVLIAAVILGSFYSVFPLPGQAVVQEAATFKASLDTIAADKPVLVVVDYEPALSGEMEAASTAVIDHIMAVGAPMAFISSSPTGQAMAANLLATAAKTPGAEAYQQAYTSGEKIANLGYLAGGPAGMYNFLVKPATTAAQWNNETPFLQGIQDLSGFQRVILITDTLETGQNWLEQWSAAETTSPALASTPLLLITSAQSAPMLRTYLDSQKIDGLISGTAGGASIESLWMKPSQAANQWGAFTGGILVSFLLVLIGGVVNGFMAKMPRRKSKDGK